MKELIGKGICELDKDVLKLCFAGKAMSPKEFSSKKREGTVLMVLQRTHK